MVSEDAWREHGESCKSHFEEAKRQILCASEELGDGEPLRTLEALATNYEVRLKQADEESLQRAATELRAAAEAQLRPLCQAPQAASTLGGQQGPVAGGRERIPLQSWRPAPLEPEAPPAADANAAGAGSCGAGCGENGALQEEALELAEPPGLAERKAEADESTRRGQYAEALCLYDQLLEETGTLQVAGMGALEAAEDTGEPKCDVDVPLRVALLCNAALCTIKLSPAQRSWARS